MKRARPLAALLAALLPFVAPSLARASGLAAVPAGHGQQAIAVSAAADGVRAKVCASSPCAADGGALLPVPDEVKAALAEARVAPIELTSGRSVVRVDLPLPQGDPEASWVLLLAAPSAGKGSEPVVVWSGYSGVSKGELGEARRTVVAELPATKSARRLLVGERREDVTLCGRPTLVAAKEVDPTTLALTSSASVQNLGPSERAAAVKITATRVPEGEAEAGRPRLLRAIAASSAVDKQFGTLTDGDAQTIWSENKASSGDGEFVTMSSSGEVGIVGFTITVRPTEEVEGGAAPRTLYLATDAKLYEVKLPEDAWKQPAGVRYAVKLPEELRASCVAVVLGDAFGAAPKGDPASKLTRVTLAEIAAVTTFGAATPEALVTALNGGGDRARGAAALLARGGPAASQAAIAAYDKLDASGKQLAAGVVDAAPCSQQAPFFAALFATLSAQKGRPRPAPGEVDPELAHARSQLRGCGRAAAPALGKLVTDGKPPASLLAAQELSLIAPAESIPILVDALAKADDAGRRELRASLARASKAERAWPALTDELAPAKVGARSEIATIDLLRAAGPSLPHVEGARPLFAQLATPSASMRTRFLLQAPAADLASGGDRQAEAFLRATLKTDPDPHLRTRAAEVAGVVPALRADLVLAIDDPEVRVREAAVTSLAAAADAPPPGLGEALARRLANDDWTIVRAAAARTIGALPKAAALDAALAKALGDLYPEVRSHAVDALGAHQAGEHAALVRKRATTPEETLDIRARALLALGEMCDRGSLDLWTKLAQNAVKPQDERDRRLGGAAVAALGVVHPADLAARLAPLLAKEAPPGLSELAKTALATKGKCP